jgi:hypothetical protein
MKDLNLGELFCEVLGGALAISLAVALLDLLGALEVAPLLRRAAATSAGEITAVLIGSYLVGLLVDAVGLCVGEWCFDRTVLGKKPPKLEQLRPYWQIAPEHVMKYRAHQWTFFSAYRAAFLLLLPGAVVFPLVIWKYATVSWAAGVLLLIIGLEVSLFASAKCLLKLYYALPALFSLEAKEP